MQSMSVTVMWPSSPAPRPMRAKFLRSSHPIAPDPTLKKTPRATLLEQMYIDEWMSAKQRVLQMFLYYVAEKACICCCSFCDAFTARKEKTYRFPWKKQGVDKQQWKKNTFKRKQIRAWHCYITLIIGGQRCQGATPESRPLPACAIITNNRSKKSTDGAPILRQSVPSVGQTSSLSSPGNTSASQASPGMLTQRQQSVHHTLCLPIRQKNKSMSIPPASYSNGLFVQV